MILRWVRGTCANQKSLPGMWQALLDRCTNRVETDVIARAAELPRAEARGYLRAKSMHRLITARAFATMSR